MRNGHSKQAKGLRRRKPLKVNVYICTRTSTHARIPKRTMHMHNRVTPQMAITRIHTACTSKHTETVYTHAHTHKHTQAHLQWCRCYWYSSLAKFLFGKRQALPNGASRHPTIGYWSCRSFRKVSNLSIRVCIRSKKSTICPPSKERKYQNSKITASPFCEIYQS